ncbi:gliotoxin biosynthesis protein [Paraphaeosphaeria sporulosa]
MAISPESNIIGQALDETRKSYMLPHNQKEIERMKCQHEWIKGSFGGLIKVPIDYAKKNQRILDSATADGTWLCDACTLFPPETELVGFDIAPELFPPAQLLPNNVALVLMDLSRDLPTAWQEQFDLVHQRFVFPGLAEKQVREFLGKLMGCVKPGGWIQLIEPAANENVSGPAPTAFHMLHKLADTCMLSPNPKEIILSELKSGGFVDINVESMDIVVVFPPATHPPNTFPGKFTKTFSMATADSVPTRTIKPEPLWYLAYGSNMKSSSMAARNIIPIAAKAVSVPTHYFTFDVFGIPYSEPCYASIEQFPDGGRGKLQLIHNKQRFDVLPLCAIAYLLSPADFNRLLVTEGSGVVYDHIKVEAYELSAAEPQGADRVSLTAYTLKSKRPQRPNGTPSARYVDLLLEGARENALPAHYIRYLESFPRYQKVMGNKKTYGQLVFDAGWRPFLRRLVRLTYWRVDKNGNCPSYIAIIVVWVYQLMWMYHDYMHCPMFGRGDGGKLIYTRVD